MTDGLFPAPDPVLCWYRPNFQDAARVCAPLPVSQMGGDVNRPSRVQFDGGPVRPVETVSVRGGVV